jgi:hypothetical protein
MPSTGVVSRSSVGGVDGTRPHPSRAGRACGPVRSYAGFLQAYRCNPPHRGSATTFAHGDGRCSTARPAGVSFARLPVGSVHDGGAKPAASPTGDEGAAAPPPPPTAKTKRWRRTRRSLNTMRRCPDAVSVLASRRLRRQRRRRSGRSGCGRPRTRCAASRRRQRPHESSFVVAAVPSTQAMTGMLGLNDEGGASTRRRRRRGGASARSACSVRARTRRPA